MHRIIIVSKTTLLVTVVLPNNTTMASHVETFLNERFPSYDLLKSRLEEEQARLRSDETETRERAEQERRRILENRQTALAKLQESLDALDLSAPLPPFVESSVSELAKEVYNDALLRDVRGRYAELRLMAAARDVVRDLETVSTAQPVFADSGRSVDELIDMYRTQIVPAEARLQVHIAETDVAHSLVRNMAQRGSQYIDSDIYGPLLVRIQTDLRQCLADAGWPQKQPDAAANSRFRQLFRDALRVQKPAPQSMLPGRALAPLVAFETLAEQYDVRFRYHFEGSRETNRPDKPEWALAFVFKVVDEATPFLSGPVQQILDAEAEQLGGDDGGSGSRRRRRRAVDEFITALLSKTVYRKLRDLVPQIIGQPRLFSHLIAEMETFDQQLREAYFYVPYGRDFGGDVKGSYNSPSSWRGITGDILATNNWFDVWVEAEQQHADERFAEIMRADDKWTVDFASVAEDQVKPTVSTVHLKYLLEGVTELYRPLTSANYQLRFLFAVQLPLVERYYRAIHAQLDNTKELPSGLDGVKLLASLYTSASFLDEFLEDLSQDLLFIELYAAMGRRALDRKTSAAASALELSHAAEWAGVEADDDDERSLFDGELAALAKLKKKAMMSIGLRVAREFEHAMGSQYFRVQWNAVPAEDHDPAKSGPSPALVQPVAIARKHLDYLRQVLTGPSFVLAQKDFAANVQRYFWKYVINANQFSITGGQQLSRDVSELWTSLGLPRDASYYRLEQACVVLCAVPALLEQDYGQKRAVEIRSTLKLSFLSDNEVDNLLKRRVNAPVV